MTAAPGPTEIVLVRHAVAVDGPTDDASPLTGQGLRQADALVGSLTAAPVAAVWSSPYRRATQTVMPAAIALGLPVRTREDLREWDDGLPYTEDWVPHYRRCWDDPSLVPAGGESLDQLADRAVAAVRAITERHHGQRVLVGSHGLFVSRLLLAFGAAVDWSFWRAMPMPAVYRVRLAVDGGPPDLTGPGLGAEGPWRGGDEPPSMLAGADGHDLSSPGA